MFTFSLLNSQKVSLFHDRWGDVPPVDRIQIPATKDKKLEHQGYIDATEIHNDKDLGPAVIEISNLISSGKSEDAKKKLASMTISNIPLSKIIEGIDMQNRGKDGRVFRHTSSLSVGVDTSDGLIKNKSNLAKLIQLYVITHDASIQYKDFKNTLAGVDGNLERFSNQGLAQIQGQLKTRNALENMKDGIQNTVLSNSLYGKSVDLLSVIEKTDKTDPEKRKKRNLDIRLLGNSLMVKSYGQESILNIQDGSMTLGIPVSESKTDGQYSLQNRIQESYPLTIHLVRNRENNGNMIPIESEINRKNIQNAIAMMNFVHFTLLEYILSPEKSSIVRDKQVPFYISKNIGKGNLILNDALVNPTDLLSKKALEGMLINARDNKIEDPEILAQFLNEIFRKSNQKAPVDRGGTYVGGGKPISSQK